MAFYKSIFIYILGKLKVIVEMRVQKAANIKVKILLLSVEAFRVFLISLSLPVRKNLFQ